MLSACLLLTGPDYGQSFTYGGTFGADYRFGNYSFGQPAIAARLSFVPGGLVGEYTYLFGPEFHMRGKHLRPYADFHLGLGNITYAKGNGRELHPTSSLSNDTSARSAVGRGFAYEFGGGVDYRLKRNYGIRLVDFQYQFWSMGTGDVFRPGEGKPPIINGTSATLLTRSASARIIDCTRERKTRHLITLRAPLWSACLTLLSGQIREYFALDRSILVPKMIVLEEWSFVWPCSLSSPPSPRHEPRRVSSCELSYSGDPSTPAKKWLLLELH